MVHFLLAIKTHRKMTFNETRLTSAIVNIIIYEGLSLNLAKKNSVQEGAGFVKKSVKRFPNSKQKPYIQGSSGCNSLSEHGKKLDFDQKRVRYFWIVISR